MHPELPRLLDLQDRDRHLMSLAAGLETVKSEGASMESAMEQMRAEVAQATRMSNDANRRRDEQEQKLEAQRTQHEKRRQRLEQERNPRLAAQLMADVELGRSIVSAEESDWLRLSEEATTRATTLGSAQARMAALEAEQAPARGELQGRIDAILSEVESSKKAREVAAVSVDRALRIRYDRLRSARKVDVLVPSTTKGTATCTACFSAIPSSRIGKLRDEGLLVEGCEMCGAMIYLPEPVA